MTKLLEQALEAARSLSPNEQDDIAHIVRKVMSTPLDQEWIVINRASAALQAGAYIEQLTATA